MGRQAWRFGVAAALALQAAAMAFQSGAAAHSDERLVNVVKDPATGEWKEVAALEVESSEGRLREVAAAISESRFKDALKLLKNWLNSYGESDIQYPAYLILRGRALLGAKEYYEAHKTLEAFLNEFPSSPRVGEAVDMEVVIAEVFLSGVNRKFLGLPILPAEDEGLQILDRISVDFPEDAAAVMAIKDKADFFFYQTGEHDFAELDYVRILTEHPGSRYEAYALKKAADSALATFKGSAFDDAPLIEAKARYEQYRRAYPDPARQEGVEATLEAIREKMALKPFEKGRFYERIGHPKTAVYFYQKALKDWPNTVAASRSRGRLIALGVGVDESGGQG